MKTFMTTFLLCLISFNTYADDLIRFSRIDQEIDHARANCLSRNEVSLSEQTQQLKSYRAVVAPKFFDQLIDQSYFLSFENLSSPVSVHARGADSLAVVDDVEIELLVKDSNGEILIATLFYWADEPIEELTGVDAKYQGAPHCSASGPQLEVNRCQFSTTFDTADFLGDQTNLFENYSIEHPNQGLIVEIHYRNTLYAECTSTNAQAVARGIGKTPKLYLRQVESRRRMVSIKQRK